MKPLELTIFFPVYNDQRTVEIVTEKAVAFLRREAERGEVLIVDDGSPDRSGEIADELSRRHGCVRVVHHPVNLGYGEALKTGFREARYEWIAFTDGDDEYEVFDFERLLRHREYYDLVISFRYVKLYSTTRILVSWIYNRAVRLFFRVPYRDVSTGLRAIRRSVVRQLSLASTSPFIGAEIAIKTMLLGYRIGEVGIQTFPRRFGRGSTVTPRNILATIADMYRIHRAVFSPEYQLPEDRARGPGPQRRADPSPSRRAAGGGTLDVERRFFDELIEQTGDFDPFTDRAWEVLASLFAATVERRCGLSVLDVGCGTGRSQSVYGDLAGRYVGIDVSLNALRSAGGVETAGPWVQSDALHLPFAHSSFDVVAYSSVLHHLTDRRLALREGLRVVRPGGFLFAFDPNVVHPPMALFRHPRSPLYVSQGVSPFERPLWGPSLRRDFTCAGCVEVTQRARSGLPYRAVAPRLLNAGLAAYNALDSILERSGLGRWLGSFLVTAGRRPFAGEGL